MKKETLAQHVFITLGKLKLKMNLQISVYAQGPMPKIYLTPKFKNRHNLHEIDKKSNRKPKRLPMILVTYAFSTILVNYK